MFFVFITGLEHIPIYAKPLQLLPERDCFHPIGLFKSSINLHQKLFSQTHLPTLHSIPCILFIPHAKKKNNPTQPKKKKKNCHIYIKHIKYKPYLSKFINIKMSFHEPVMFI